MELFFKPLCHKGKRGLHFSNSINNTKRHGGAVLTNARLLYWEGPGNGPVGIRTRGTGNYGTNQGRSLAVHT